MINSEKAQASKKFVTIKIGSQYFGIPVEHVVDILLSQKVYPIPLARKEIIGSINLRGRVVTALDLRVFLDIKSSISLEKGKCIVLEHSGELVSFFVDEVGTVNNFSMDSLIKTPDTLSSRWQEISFGILAVEKELVIILDINKIIESIVN